MSVKTYLNAITKTNLFSSRMELKEFIKYAGVFLKIRNINRNNTYAIWKGTKITHNSIEGITNVAKEVGVEEFIISNRAIKIHELSNYFSGSFPDKEYNPFYAYYKLHINPSTIYERLWRNENKDEKYTLIIGAGASQSVGVPGWEQLLDQLKKEFWDNELIENKKIINKNKQIKCDSNTKSKDITLNTLRVARVIRESQAGRTYYNKREDFDRKIATIINDNYDETLYNKSSMKAIVEFIKVNRGRIDSIITYNYDDILENMLYEGEVNAIAYYTGFDNQVEAEKYGDNLDISIPIYHVHGFIKMDADESEKVKSKIVLTESDYYEEYSNPMSFSNIIQIEKFKNNACIFIGVSFADPNMRKNLDCAIKFSTTKYEHYWIEKDDDGVRYNNYYKELATFEKWYEKIKSDLNLHGEDLISGAINIIQYNNEIKKFYDELDYKCKELLKKRNEIDKKIENEEQLQNFLFQLIDCRSFGVYPCYIQDYNYSNIENALNDITLNLK